MPVADAFDVVDVLDDLEREVAASPLAPGGLLALNTERIASATARLRVAAAQARAQPADDTARAARLRQAQAEAALTLEEARRKAEMLLSGARVDALRAAQVEEMLREGRRQGEALVSAAYAYAETRIAETHRRASAALRHVAAACDEVREEPPRPVQRLATAVSARAGGLLARLVARLLRV